jgi:hypothetical protein
VWVSSIFAAAANSATYSRLQNRGGSCFGKSFAHNYLHEKNLFLVRSSWVPAGFIAQIQKAT